MYDAIVVGARCAGSPTAMLLARKGYRVLVVDRATFPSDTMSTHNLHAAALVRLQHWGLLDRILATGVPPSKGYDLRFGPIRLQGTPPAVDGIELMYSPRRTYVDKILVDAAAEAGAEVREGFSVQEVVMDGDRVTGIRGRTSGGSVVTEEARVVVGADGLHSLVARAVKAPGYNEQPALACYYYSYWSGVPADDTLFCLGEGHMLLKFPTNDGLTGLAVGLPNARFQEYRADIEGTFMNAWASVPEVAEQISAGKREERWTGTADLPNLFRKPYGPGWALAGDAGLHKDPVLAQGITDAFRDADLLAAAMDDGFSGRLPLNEALAGYEQQRNEAILPIYELTCQMAALDQPPPAETIQLLLALQGNPAATKQFLGLVAGTTSFQTFFAPANIGSIMASAPGAVPA